MSRPRYGSRLDPKRRSTTRAPAGGFGSSAQDTPKSTSSGARTELPASPERDDPGRLIEQTFLASASLCDVEDLILAWLAILPRGIPPPLAARRLYDRLRPQAPSNPAPHQQRLLELLAFIAKHRRRH